MMKNVLRIVAAALVVSVLAVMLASCGPKALGIYGVYVGEEVTSTNHEFIKEDFKVVVAYDNGVDEFTTDFKYEVLGMKNGNYEIDITFKDIEYTVYVPIKVDVYPSDFEE